MAMAVRRWRFWDAVQHHFGLSDVELGKEIGRMTAKDQYEVAVGLGKEGYNIRDTAGGTIISVDGEMTGYLPFYGDPVGSYLPRDIVQEHEQDNDYATSIRAEVLAERQQLKIDAMLPADKL